MCTVSWGPVPRHGQVNVGFTPDEARDLLAQEWPTPAQIRLFMRKVRAELDERDSPVVVHTPDGERPPLFNMKGY